MTRVRIFFHDRCFDGAASAALFAAFYRAHVAAGRDVDIALRGLHHTDGDPFAGQPFDADDHACVDFRYSPRLSWWFDHHASAFQPPSLRAAFEADDSGQLFFDPGAPSCTGFIARVLAERFDWRADGFDDVVRWADVIDAAAFPDARTAVELSEPAVLLATWVEHNRDRSLAERFIHALGQRPLAEISAQPWVREPLAPVLAAHQRHVELIGRRGTLRDDVVTFDLIDDGVGVYNKFIAYMLFPEARYAVGVSRLAERCKIGVGYNPWCERERGHDIAALCERFGGGGHAAVGGVSYGYHEVERTRAAAAAIVDALRAAAPSA